MLSPRKYTGTNVGAILYGLAAAVAVLVVIVFGNKPDYRLMEAATASCRVSNGGHHDSRTSAKIVLVLVGLVFLALVYPLTIFFGRDSALAMMLSLYVTLGIFLLIAARNPSTNRNLIAFTAWSSFARASLKAFQAYRKVIERGELVGVAALVVIGVALVTLAPAKPSGSPADA
jgi:hypothetical protein